VNFFDNTEEKPKPKGLGQYATEKLAEFEAAKPVTSTARNHAVAQPTNGNGSVFDQLDEHADWYDDILASKGWAEVKPGDSQTLRAFRRPGATYPISAKVLKVNPHVLVNHSEDSGLPVGAGQKLTKARVLAHLHYGGDESALAKALIRGDAIGPRPHIAQLFKSEQSNHFTVTEVTVDQVTGNTGEVTEDNETETPSSWRPVDLTSVLDGTWKPPEPCVGRRSDGKGLFYPGRTHTVVSETEAGKTWFALAASIHEMTAGCHVFYIDFEDDEGSVVGRLLSLGVDPEAIHELFHYIRPEHPLQGTHLDALCEELAHYGPSLAHLDGITEAMNMHGLNPNDNVDISTFNRRVNMPLTASGAAQVSFDHVTKDREGRGRYAIGGVHKLNIVSGAGYTLENRQPFGIGTTGRSTLKIAKDRPAQLRRHAVDKWYADLVLASDADGRAEVAIESPQERVAERETAEPFRPTTLMEKVSKYIEGGGEADSQNDILKGVDGKRDWKISALKILKEEGYVTPTRPYQSLMPYRAKDEK
jgi:hypothetical protein